MTNLLLWALEILSRLNNTLVVCGDWFAFFVCVCESNNRTSVAVQGQCVLVGTTYFLKTVIEQNQLCTGNTC